MAELHPRLVQDCIEVGRFVLCRVLLMNDANYPWFILVPDRDDISEIHHLPESDQRLLWRESALFSAALEKAFNPDKLNIAALGNVVPQLHIHHVARYQDDPAWPAPVWGAVSAQPYSDEGVAAVVARLKQAAPIGLEFAV